MDTLPYKHRWLKMKEALNASGMDLAILTSPASIFYLTGFYSDPHERFMALVIEPGKDGYTLLVPALDEESARGAAQVGKLVGIGDTDDAYALLERETGAQASVVGVESAHLRYSGYLQLARLYGQAAFRDAEPLVMGLRLVKSEGEIELVKKAVALAEQVLAETAAKAAPGVTELELNAEIEYRLRVLGGDKPAFETSVLGGVRTALPHGRSSAYKLQENDLLLIDMGVYKDGYCSDITRTFLIGEGTDSQRRIYDSVLKANRSALAAVKAGRPLAEVDRAARSVIDGDGYGFYFTHRTGHGMGIDVHEQPSVHGENKTLMQAGLLFTIEPGVYIPEIGGVRIEDDVYIGLDGQPVVLTSYPRELTRL
ncbi:MULTISPECIES: Xaa-Pro peptidase family protein [unclassified Paenibacillus]|uniref:M24 family metallopeptidase n=1 Tax=unclassified Paenibacillus TaxID=185978 RepID=UPI000956D4B1|nr:MULTISPECIES: Xaa-Pro peptidase family protein [unclassified Paenibacillus]ASS68876.1 aminopeptidase P family protein [Paenibacillus sp. RUD330]SIR16782.1 Xaa-Pro dipeptidase [Paenibacillus sp. RU4X]SIR21626.1 Xaa-Pro dipeptidase [Paenibacillus sp. RU4T]